MRTLFHPVLPNGPAGDPLLWVDLPDEGHAVLIDLGELGALTPRKLLRVDRVVVTHTHMDHFIGFDALLRLCLGRERELALTGPVGFLDRVAGRISGYTWNLIDGYPIRLLVEEVDGPVVRSARYTGRSRMRPEGIEDRRFTGVVHAHRAYTLHVASFDHGVPVLGVLLRETEHLSVNRDRLERLGLVPGPWLSRLKNDVRRAADPDEEIEADDAHGFPRRLRRGELEAEILLRGRGQRVAYLTDLAYTPANVERAIELARDVDLLVCEAAFLEEDAALARARNHLTARQCGELASAAGAARLAPFHFSSRYAGREEEFYTQAAAAFSGTLVRL